MVVPHNSARFHIYSMNVKIILLITTTICTLLSSDAFFIVNIPIKKSNERYDRALSALRPWRLSELALEEKQKIEKKLLKSTDDPTDDDIAPKDDNNDDDDDDGIQFGNTVCRIVAAADGKLPSMIPPSLSSSNLPILLDSIDAICHAKAHAETRRLGYMQSRTENGMRKLDSQFFSTCNEEEIKTTQILRKSLEDAGFELLSQRDLHLCEALNEGYLLRLSIKPELSGFDENLGQTFFPEFYTDLESNETEYSSLTKNSKWKNEKSQDTHDLLFNGRVLIFRRGYSQEITRGKWHSTSFMTLPFTILDEVLTVILHS